MPRPGELHTAVLDDPVVVAGTAAACKCKDVGSFISKKVTDPLQIKLTCLYDQKNNEEKIEERCIKIIVIDRIRSIRNK